MTTRAIMNHLLDKQFIAESFLALASPTLSIDIRQDEFDKFYSQVIAKLKKLKIIEEKKDREIGAKPQEKWEDIQSNQKEIILNLDSNPSIFNRKPHFYLDLKLKPFEKYAEGAREEIKDIQTPKFGLFYRKTTPCEVAYPFQWALKDDIQTPQIINSSLYKLLKAVKEACYK